MTQNLIFYFCIWHVLNCTALANSQKTTSPASPKNSIEIPPENVTKSKMPDFSTTEILAKRLLTAIQKNDAESVLDLFFPEAEFIQLKSIANPKAYYGKLVGWFRADIAREHKRIKNIGPLTFLKVKKGYCKWKPVNSEYNSIAYWSCYRSYFFAVAGTEEIRFDLRALINWGKSWRVTHLGPIPKQ